MKARVIKMSAVIAHSAIFAHNIAAKRSLFVICTYPLTATKFSFTSLGEWDNIYQVRIQYHLEKFIL